MSVNEGDHPHIIQMPDLDMSIDERGVGYVFFNKMKEHRDKIIQIDGTTGEEDTYKSLLQRCIRTSIVMQKKGIKPQDIISICSENHLDAIVPYFAAIFLGAHSVCFDPYSSDEANMFLIEQTNVVPKMLFVSKNSVEFAKTLVRKHTCEVVVFGCTTEYTPFQKFLEPSVVENDFQPYQADSLKSIVMMQFSSGSSGSPKLVCTSHRAYLGQIQIRLKCRNYYDRILIFTTLHWITSTAYWGVIIMSGSTRIIFPKFRSDKLFHLIHTYKPTFLALARYNTLTIDPTTKGNFDISSLKSVAVNGSALNKEQLLWLKGIFPGAKVWNCYGTTEASLIMYPHTETTQEVEFFHHKLMSCGTGLVGRSYKVVNPETEEILGPNEIGELRIKSKYTASWYYNMDPSDLFDSNGWLKTGDLVYYDSDGYFYIVDRLKDLIRVKTASVYPLLLENILLSHPSVKEAVVIGKKHPIDGDQPMAVVVTREKGKITENELVKFVDDKVENFMRLKGGITFVDCVPLTPSGKVSRYLTKKYVREIEQEKFQVDGF